MQRYNEEKFGRTVTIHTPFLEALKLIGVTPRLLPNLEAYQSGKFSDAARIACDKPDAVREIIERVSERELSMDWFSWQPLDSKGSLDGVQVTGYAYPRRSLDGFHGVDGSSNIEKRRGKLPWRLDWPAKWGFNAIAREPFGKDHGAEESYDTGKEIALLFGHEPPVPLTYEWISLRGKGAMSSSSGNTVGPIEALRLVPPEHCDSWWPIQNRARPLTWTPAWGW